MTCQLYRHFDADGNLLYVGISLGVVRRLSQHKSSSPWFDQIKRIEIQQCSSRQEALVLETIAIKSEKPKYNKANAKPVIVPPPISQDKIEARLARISRKEDRRRMGMELRAALDQDAADGFPNIDLPTYKSLFGIPYRYIAEKCNCSVRAISMIAEKKLSPSLELSILIEKVTNGRVSRNSWHPDNSWRQVFTSSERVSA